MATFKELVIHEAHDWTLHLHQSQYYLGRCYLWLRRPGPMQRLSSLGVEERLSLQVFLVLYENVVERLWHPDHMNYAWLGNDLKGHGGHGHMHLIPRYTRPVAFGGAVFIDERWGQNYAPYPMQTYPDTLLFAIRDAILMALARK